MPPRVSWGHVRFVSRPERSRQSSLAVRLSATPPATFAGNTVNLSITDGGLGDDDLTANGTIVDAGGPV